MGTMGGNDEGEELRYIVYASFFVPRCLLFLATGLFYVATLYQLWAHFSFRLERKIAIQIFSYLAIFMLCWLPSICRGLSDVILDHAPLPLVVAESYLLPLVGLCSALVYGIPAIKNIYSRKKFRMSEVRRDNMHVSFATPFIDF